MSSWGLAKNNPLLLQYDTWHHPGRHVWIDEQRWLHFSGTAYLGLGQHPDYLSWMKAGLERYGTHYGASRNGNLRLPVFAAAEALLAEWTTAECSLLLSSGTLAGQLVARCLSADHQVIMAPGVHPALWPFGQKPLLDWRAWREQLAALPEGKVTLFLNGIDPLRVEKVSYDWLALLPKDRSIVLVVDDSHNIGVTGLKGGGTYTGLPLPESVELIVTGSLGKALSLPAGFVSATRARIESLRQTPFFAGAAPPSPATAHTFLQAMDLVQQQRQRLFALGAYLGEKIQAFPGFRFMADYPVVGIDRGGAGAFLEKHQMMISSLRYPSADDPLRERIVISAAHEREDLDRLVAVLEGWMGET